MFFAIHWHESAMDLHVIPHPDPPSHLPLHPIPLGLPSAPAPSTHLMHPTWAGDLGRWDNILDGCNRKGLLSSVENSKVFALDISSAPFTFKTLSTLVSACRPPLPLECSTQISFWSPYFPILGEGGSSDGFMSAKRTWEKPRKWQPRAAGGLQKYLDKVWVTLKLWAPNSRRLTLT